LLAEPVPTLDARKQRLLDQVVDVVPDFVEEEPIKDFEVAFEQLLTGKRIAGPPLLEQRLVTDHDANLA
jgi:hypothetical protein